MSSLSAARADGFYNPPNWDPSKMSRDQYQQSKGANQYQQFGIIRFEMPFNFVCTGSAAARGTAATEHVIGAGTRFNSKKDHVDDYFTTKIYEFKMKCADCKNEIVIRTDPKNRAYLVVKGGRVKVEGFTAKQAGVSELPSEEIAKRRATDKIFDLERDVEQKTAVARRNARIAELIERQKGSRDGFALNSALRKTFRTKKKELIAETEEAKRLGLSYRLLKANDEDRLEAARHSFRSSTAPYSKARQLQKAKLRATSIFDDPSSKKSYSLSSGGGGSKALQLQTRSAKRQSSVSLESSSRAQKRHKALLKARMTQIERGIDVRLAAPTTLEEESRSTPTLEKESTATPTLVEESGSTPTLEEESRSTPTLEEVNSSIPTLDEESDSKFAATTPTALGGESTTTPTFLEKEGSNSRSNSSTSSKSALATKSRSSSRKLPAPFDSKPSREPEAASTSSTSHRQSSPPGKKRTRSNGGTGHASGTPEFDRSVNPSSSIEHRSSSSVGSSSSAKPAPNSSRKKRRRSTKPKAAKPPPSADSRSAKPPRKQSRRAAVNPLAALADAYDSE